MTFEMQRLGKNHDGYHGETIDIGAVVEDCLGAARRHGWALDEMSVAPELTLFALRRQSTLRDQQPASRIYLSTGIHGDEPAGPLSVRRLLHENHWPAHAEIWLCPCLNPTGFPLNRRENAQGKDLNRDYRHLESAEIRAHTAWLGQQPAFDLTLCIHEDWESHGFYLYELNPENRPTLAEKMIQRVSTVCPIDPSPVIEDRPAQNGIIRPSIDPNSRPQWPEAFFLVQNKTRLSYTLEAPSDFPLSTRVDALVAAIRAALDSF